MLANGLEKEKWNVQPDNTIQVVDPHGIKEDPMDIPRNWNGILISLAIIGFVGIMVAAAALLVVPLQEPPFYGRPLTLGDIGSSSLRPATLVSQWLSRTELAYISEDGSLLLKNTDTNATTTLVSSFTMKQLEAEEFAVSWNRLFVLLTHDVQKGRLYTKTARYSIYDLNKNHYFPLKLSKTRLEHPRYQFAQWMKSASREMADRNSSSSSIPTLQHLSPGSELVIVHKNDIYLLPHPLGDPKRLTEDGEPNKLFNGVPDLMNEEIMKRGSCLWPSGDGRRLAYLSFAEDRVQQTPVIEYGVDEQPNFLSLRYPTVTSNLPEVSIHVAEVSTSNFENVTKWRLLSPISFMREEHYVIGVGWVNDHKLWVSEVSRDQSTSHLMTCEGKSWNCTSVFVNHLEGGISPLVESVVWLKEWAAFPWPIRTPSGWWYNHVALVGAKSRKHPTIKLEECHVNEVLAADPSSNLVYFLGSKLSKGTETQQLYSVSTAGNAVVCISCKIGCPRVKTSLNGDLPTHAVLTCVGIHVPTMHLISLSPSNERETLHSQPMLRKEISEIALPIATYETIALSHGLRASISLILPPGYDSYDDSLFYPLIIQLVGLESFEEVDVEQPLGLKDLLASEHYIAHARIKFWVGGFANVDDSIQTKAIQMERVIRTFLEKHQFLDNSLISLWGWGSGASLALKIIERNTLNLKCVMAVNPVRDWKQYGSFWSERFLGSIYSEGASRRYEASNILRAFDNANGTQILLMQSAKDPLSHHSSGIAKHLISKGIYFQNIVYPDGTVALRNENLHMIKSFKTFIINHKCVKSFSIY